MEAGVPLVEIDVRASKDGELFVIHDGKLENSTSLRGRVETVIGSRIAAAVLKNGESVPRFGEVYGIARGRVVLTVHFKANVIEEVADWIHANGSFDDLIFYADTGEEMQSAASARRRYPHMIVMVRLLDTRITVESTRSVLGRLPEIFHTDPLGAAGVAALQAQGVKVYMSALRPEQRYFQPFKYFAVRRLVQAKPDFLLTGEPLSLMRRLGSGG